MKLDYQALGLKVGLEIHQQLDTREKLFCSCPTVLRDDPPHYRIIRRLRPTQSELGEVDEAAMFEFKKGRYFIYECYEDTTCLVEMDEEPPHNLNPEAVEIALQIALMLNMTPVDEIHVMRKVVIDGSNTTGFQRTARIAMGGWVDDEEGRVRIQTLCLEEDAARKIKEEGLAVYYRLDRLGIPLVEIATAPDIHSPEQAQRVALRIGQILRATRKVKRGIGTIRQDLNISISGGARIEIKGVQELELISKVVEYEVLRQLSLLAIRDELQRRGVREVPEEVYEVTEVFKNTKSKVIRRTLEAGGGVYAVVLPKFAGLVSKEIQPGRRFGTELSDYARVAAGVGGIFHTDELPAYGITQEEVDALRKAVGASPDDCVVFVAAEAEKARKALEAVVSRARYALEGVPKESRAANPDGTTRYMRPMPGAARMYPETDVPSIVVSKSYLEELRSKLPELPEQKVKRFMESYGLTEDLAKLMVNSAYVDLFEKLASKPGVPPVLVASTFEYTLKSLKREGVEVSKLSDKHFEELFDMIAEGRIAKEAIPDILTWLASHPEASVEDAVKALGIETLSLEEFRAYVKSLVESNAELVLSNPSRAHKVLMGEIMKKYRGKVDGKQASQIVLEEINRYREAKSSE